MVLAQNRTSLIKEQFEIIIFRDLNAWITKEDRHVFVCYKKLSDLGKSVFDEA